MARGKKAGPALPDFHLWSDVARTVTPLPGRSKLIDLDDTPLPLPGPMPPAKLKKAAPSFPPMPSYQPSGRPGRGPGHGIEPGVKRRLQRGHIDIDATIDLHGMRQVEAEAALSRFIHARVARGDRTVLVITGKGLKKMNRDAAVIVETGILRTMLPIWLSSARIAPLIAGWDSAAQGHGGEGAFYVRLRRQEHPRVGL